MIGELLIGAGCALGGVTVGHLQGYLMGVKVKNLTSLVVNRDPVITQSTTTCQCGHGLQTHRLKGQGICTVLVGERLVHRCACQFFVGKEITPPQPPNNELDLS